MPLYELGARAVQTLQQRLSGAEGVDVVIRTPPPEIIERASVRRLG
jgi:DNA-binding LacI/PurR family transcriptional regulator